MTPRCVLVVEGVPVMARMLVDAFAEAGWESEVATRVGDALRAIESGRFSAVVSEVEVPEGDGFELSMRARSLPGGAPAVVLIGAHASRALSRRAEEAGAVGYLPKPFELNALMELLEGAGAPHAAG